MLKELQAKYSTLYGEVKALLEASDMSEVYETKNTELTGMAAQIKAMRELEANAPPDLRTGIPLGTDTPPANTEMKAAELKAARLKTVQVLRYGDVDEHQDHIFSEIYDGDWRQKFYAQDNAFKSFVRYAGDHARMDPAEYKLGGKRYWDTADVLEMLKEGMNVSEIKATMVAGQDTLGGYAVPPQRARRILSEVVGLTIVRQNGAWVVRTNSTTIDWLKVTGGTTGQYPGALRGVWAGETASPDAKNLTFGTETITTSLYTYKVPMSETLLATAGNAMAILEQQIIETMAIDEDIAFLTGDGLNGPRGIFPKGVPETGVTVLTSADSATFTIEELKSLRRQIATRYRMTGRAVYGFNSATADFIEQMQDGEGRFYFNSVGLGEGIYGSPSRESEAMPDIAALAYPMFYGDLRGYAIVEAGPGLEIFRFRDSNTGPNVVEFHIRRRLGGKVVEPYRLAALRCKA